MKIADYGIGTVTKGINFILLHVHTIVGTLLLPNLSITDGVVWYAMLMLSPLIVMAVLLYIKGPVAFLIIGSVIVVHLYSSDR